jgi:ADP-L-glycero-D-manno-heptose 6-epimerase
LSSFPETSARALYSTPDAAAQRCLPKRCTGIYKRPSIEGRKDMTDTILVTGGAGFIGSNLVAELAERGERVVVCDRLGEDDKWRNLAKHELEDFVAPEALGDYLASRGAVLSAVVHLAAVSATTATDGDLLVADNFKLSQGLWNWCAEARKPLLYASSAATYGDGAAGFDDDMSVAYLERLRPLNAYGWSKHLFDRWVARRLVTEAPSPPQWAGLKFFNVYGPNEYHKGTQASVAWQLFGQISKGKPARLFKSHRKDTPDGGQRRDFVWVGDCIDVLLWLLDNPQASGLFNLGTGRARSFAELAQVLFAVMERAERIEYAATPKPIRDTYQYFTEANMERLAAAGYERSFTSLEAGVACYLRDFLTNDDPYR